VLVKHLSEKLSTLNLPEAERADLLRRAAARVDDTVRPAFQRFVALVDELDARSSDDAGVWKLPDGEKRYTAYLRAV
jgi:uncharacterized protein (DUF885 family)